MPPPLPLPLRMESCLSLLVLVLLAAVSPAAAAIQTSLDQQLGQRDSDSPCVAANGTRVPCSRANQRCSNSVAPFPSFHIHDRGGCGNNDVNAPFYDARFGLYHVMFQEHLSLSNGGAGQGPVFGHVVSHDLVHWARLDVAIWNDRPYDDVAIYTGSATIVDGMPTIVYPGLCAPKPEYPQCDGGQDHCHLAIAVPANLSDPLCRNWSKPSYNPIVNSTQRDP